jgi:hypothetical protein
MDCLLAQWGVSRLFLKDVSPWMYFKGVKGLSEDLHTLPAALDNLIAAFGCTGKILTGFSSGGYASLFCALQLKDAAYVGFSTYTNIERSSNLPMVKMFETIRHELPVSDFQDLRKLAVEEPLTRPFYFYFGERDATDRAHAIHMDGLKNIKISKLADVHHDVPGAMIEQRLMSDAFRSVIEHFSAEKLNESE